MSFVDCVVDADYEIYTEYPHQIRRKSNKKIIKEGVDKTGYVYCCLNCNKYLKHRIIALQFIENDDPDNKTEVDHINHIKTDNRVENLRWVTRSENNSNRRSYIKQKIQYVDELPDDFIEVILYNGREFEGYSYSPSENKFYFDNGARIRVINLSNNYGYERFKARDITGVYRDITVQKWLRDEGLI